MLPYQVQNFDEPLTKRDVLIEIIEEIGTDDQRSSVGKNMSVESYYGLWGERIDQLLILRQYERNIQSTQRNIVSSNIIERKSILTKYTLLHNFPDYVKLN